MNNINKKNVGQRIKNIRVKRKETLEEFANQIQKETNFSLKTTKSNVSKWEKGLNIPNDISLQAIATLGDVSTEYILNGNDFSLDKFIDLDTRYSMTADEKTKSIKKIEEMINNTSNIAKKDVLTKVKDIDQFERFDLISLNKIMDLFIMFKGTPAISAGFFNLAHFVTLVKDDLENPTEESLTEKEIIEGCQRHVKWMIESITKEKDETE